MAIFLLKSFCVPAEADTDKKDNKKGEYKIAYKIILVKVL